jgi:hypothetical protein
VVIEAGADMSGGASSKVPLLSAKQNAPQLGGDDAPDGD